MIELGSHPPPRAGGTFAVCLILLLATCFVPIVGGPAATRAADAFGEPTPGKRVHDQAELLTPSEEAGLEIRADAPAQAGLSTIVVLRRDDHNSDYEATEDDAHALMNAWDVESSAGAKDGLVVPVDDCMPDYPNLPTALWADETQSRGSLPPAEQQRIYEQKMRTDPRAGRIYEGVWNGLVAVGTSP